MAGVVTRLAYQKRNKQRVNVYLDDSYAFALTDIEAARLKIGQHLGDDEILQFRQLDSEAKAFEKAIRYLGHRPRSLHEVEIYLERAEFSSTTQATIISRLEQLGYIDDLAFVQWWFDNRSRFSPRGSRALRQELWQKGVDSHLIEQALAAFDEDAQALAAGLKRSYRWSHLSQQDFDDKMLGYLQRRGFSYPVARNASDQLWQRLHNENSQHDT